ncbi:MAG: HAMP domain-containing sensor histidine kinase [Pseudomonadota bacterium]
MLRSTLAALKPDSAKATLALIVLMLSTLLMGVFAAGSYLMTEQRMHAQRNEMWIQMQRHLGQPVAMGLWNFDLKGLNATLSSELGGSVLGLAVVDDSGKVVTHIGHLLPVAGGTLPPDAEVLSMDIPPVDGHHLGRIEVGWSDASLRSALNTTLWLAIAQLIGVSLLLLAVVWVGVDRLIFKRVQQLQHALDHAAGQDMAADLVALPVTAQDEFGDITRSINAITTRLGVELEAGKKSEEEARTALTNMQNAQEGLVQAEKMAALGRLVAGVAHELNTPIGNIMMVASTQQEVTQQLDEAIVSGALTRSALTSLAGRLDEGAVLMLSSSRRAAELIQNFKQVAVDQTTDQLRDFDLDQQIAEMLSVINHVLAKTSLTLVQQLEPGITMHSYPGPLGQVVTNLVMNAAKHGFEGTRTGTITVACSRQGDRACITVSDDGVGIPPENVGKIFDPFFTTKLGQGGTGLGLHISHNMVYGPLGGRMTVQSTPGVSTTFTLYLPFWAPDSNRH